MCGRIQKAIQQKKLQQKKWHKRASTFNIFQHNLTYEGLNQAKYNVSNREKKRLDRYPIYSDWVKFGWHCHGKPKDHECFPTDGDDLCNKILVLYK